MSSRKRAALAVAVVGVLVAGFGPDARAQDAPKTTGEKIKEGFSGAASAVGSAGRKVADSVKATFARTKDSVHNMGVEARVYGRLHWDKALGGSDITLETHKDGTLVLHGVVPSAEAKIKAVLLASETIGVNKVDDLLTVGTPTTIETETTIVTPGSPTTTETSKKTVVRPKP